MLEVKNFIEDVFSSIHPLGALFLALFFAIFFGVYSQFKSDRGIARLSFLISISWRKNPYRYMVNKIAEFVSSHISVENTDHNHSRSRTLRNPWTYKFFEICLKFSFIYPLFLMLTQWGLGFQIATIGNLALLPENIERWVRYLTIFAVFFFTFSVITWPLLTQEVRTAIRIVSFAAAIAVAIAFVQHDGTSVDLEGAGPIARGLAFSGVIAGVVFSNYRVVASSVACGIAGGLINHIPTFLLVCLMSFIVIYSAAALLRFSVRSGCGLGGYSTLVLLLLICAAATLTIAPHDSISAPGWILFLIIFPTINAVFDFFSLGLTFYLMRSAALKGSFIPIIYGITDLIFALVLFTLLIWSKIIFLEVFNMISGQNIFPIASTISALSESGNALQYAWLIAIIFSTIIPTLAHASIACFCLVGAFPKIWGSRLQFTGDTDKPIRDAVEELLTVPGQDNTDRLVITLTVSTIAFTCFVMPFFLSIVIAHSLPQIAPGLASVYLKLFTWTHANIFGG